METTLRLRSPPRRLSVADADELSEALASIRELATPGSIGRHQERTFGPARGVPLAA
jgi:hypothetical protein